LSVKGSCFGSGERATPLQTAVTHLKNIAPAFALFEMNAGVFRSNPLANGRPVDLPNVRSSSTDRDAIVARENFFHILSTGHFYDAHDTVTVQIIHDFGMKNGADPFKDMAEVFMSRIWRERSNMQLIHKWVTPLKRRMTPKSISDNTHLRRKYTY
jgi:hypothetical protein